jgi:uncharacterized protein
VRAPLAVALALLLVPVFSRAPVAIGQEPVPRPGSSAPSITVVGSGSVPGRPDTAELTAGIVTQATSAAQALAENSASMEKILKAATGLAISERDVQTSGLSVAPQRRQERSGPPSRPEIVGYEVTNEIRVKVRDLGKLGRLLDQFVGQGANLLGGVRFYVDNPASLLDQARTKAMVDARRKAELYATAAGVKLGRVLFIQESGSAMPSPRVAYVAPMRAAQAVPVAPGEQEFEASVSVSYAIE